MSLGISQWQCYEIIESSDADKAAIDTVVKPLDHRTSRHKLHPPPLSLFASFCVDIPLHPHFLSFMYPSLFYQN